MYKKITENDWPEYYQNLGQFIVNFENIVFDIRKYSNALLTDYGLTDKILGEIIFGLKTFTADPLLNCYVAMANHLLKDHKDGLVLAKRLDLFKNKFLKTIELRNDIVHSTHFYVESIDFTGSPKLFTDFKAYKPNPTKAGYAWKKTPRAELVAHTESLMEIRNEFRKLVEDLHEFLTKNRTTL